MGNNTETFLEEALGNFYDCINNAVYVLQKYIDKFYKNIPEIYQILPDIKEGKLNEVLRFISSENENIIKAKGISFVVEVTDILIRKYSGLVSKIKNPSNVNCLYRISNEAYSFFDEYQEDMNWKKLQMGIYTKKSETNNFNLDFVEYSEKEFERFKNYKFEMSNKDLDKDEFISILDTAVLKLTISMTELKKITEDSQSVYCTFLCCQKMITLMILVYHVMCSIQIL